ncbi:MAG: carboxypeptidase regulatory-like domain-containing protein [Bryobacteraceae bacterium]
MLPKRHQRPAGFIFIRVLLAMALVVTVLAQDYRAKVQGVITDSSQAAVAGAQVALRNNDTGIVISRQSSDIGKYLFDYVEPGVYTLSVEQRGFTKVVQENVGVRARGDVTVNVTLNPGQVMETVTVSETPVAVQFNTSSIAVSVSRRMLNDLPVLSRSPFEVVALNPAIIRGYGPKQFSPMWMWAPGGPDFGGGTSGQNELLLDGAPLMVGGKGSYVPPMDASQELVIQQNSVDAEFGNSAGGVMSLSTKSGTNEIHGTASYFGRNPHFSALTNAVSRTPNMMHSSIWGGSVGGPIRKSKLFTFGAWEQYRNAEPRVYTGTQPTALERAGDFSQSLNASSGLRAIFDPWSTVFDPASGAVTRTQFPGNRIPSSRIDATAGKIAQDIWLPNGPGDDVTGVNNYRLSYPNTMRFWNFNNRTDWNINEKWKVFGRYSRWVNHAMPPNFADSRALVVFGSEKRARNISGDTVYMMSPRTVINFRAGFASLRDDYANHDRGTVTLKDLEQFWPGNAWYTPYFKDLPLIYYPNVSISGYGSFGKGGYYMDHPRTFSFSGRASQERGRHYLKTGMEFRRHGSDPYWPAVQSFAFSQALTADTFLAPNTRLRGDSFATFLLGGMGSDSYADVISLQHMGMRAYALYFQDDFKLNRKITLNLGMRYEYEGSPFDSQNRYSRNLDLTNPIPEMQANPPAIPADVAALMKTPYRFNGAWVFSDDGNRGVFQASKLSFMPRIGLALRVSDKTALRVGWARFIVPPVMLPGQIMHQGLPTPGFSARTTVAPVLEGIPGARLSDPFPASNPLILPRGKSLGRYTNLGDSTRWFEQDMKTGVNDRINVSLQRQVPGSIVVDITYFANLGHNRPYDKYVNLADPGLSYTHKAALQQTVQNPFFNYLTPDKFPGQLRNQKTVTKASLLVPYPQYGTIYQRSTHGVLDRYHALQIKAERAFSKGFGLLLGYNYNRQKTYDFFNADDQYADKFTFQNSSNPRHRLSMAHTYELPVGRGRALFPNVHPVVNAILGGWSTSSILLWNSGSFLRFPQAIVEGDPVIDNPTRARWFDTSKFKVPVAFTPRTNHWQYPGLTGPRYWQLDGTVSKFFPVRERFRLEFKLEAYNLTNSFIAGNPETNVFSSLFGRSTSQANWGRDVQYSLKLYF